MTSVVLDTRPPRGRIAGAILLTLGIGLIAVLAGALGGVQGAGAVAVLVVGGLFVAIGLGLATMYRRLMRPRSLHFEPAGIRWADSAGASWAVGWHELAGVEAFTLVTSSDWQQGRRGPVTRYGIVFVHLIPADAGFAARHPQMGHLLGNPGAEYGYCQPLGPQPERVAVIEQGVRTFRPDLYRGARKH